MVSREMPADDGALVTVVPSMGAKGPTVCASSGVMKNTIRTVAQRVGALLTQRMREVAEGATAMHSAVKTNSSIL